MKKILRIPYSRVIALLAPIRTMNDHAVIAPNTIPPGTYVLAVHENFQCRSFDFVLEHESFPEVPAGIMLPVIHPEWVSPSTELSNPAVTNTNEPKA